MAIKIGDREVGIGLKPYIIAEASTQHRGRVNSAKSLARRAKRCGADAIKFQMFTGGEPLFCPLNGDEKRWPRWEKSFMTFAQWRAVKEYCDDIGIDFLASAFQYKTVEWLQMLKVKAYKVASRAPKTYPYDKVPGPFLVSLGMAGDMVFHIDNYLYLQCESHYPHPPQEWDNPYDLAGNEGFSDHSGSPWPSIHAMARGCALIEVHVSFFTSKDDPDGASSVTPSQLRLICDARDGFAALRQD